MNLGLDTAVVLAGGPSTRLKPFTNDLPKAMVRVCDKPLLQWVIEWLKANGVVEIVLGVAYLKEKIMEYFGDGAKLGVDIRYSVHTSEGGTCEGFRLAIGRFVDRGVFFAVNGDQIVDLRLSELADFHVRNGSVATIVTTSLRCPCGQVQVDENHRIVEFVEKPSCFYMQCNAG